MRSERELVRWIRSQRGVHRSLGDDCAVLPAVTPGCEMLVTTDMLIEDVHFRRRHAPELVGHQALGRGLSDIAAMGARPRWCFLSLALPAWAAAKRDWVERFYAGLLALARGYRTELAGGDLSHTADGLLAADITVIGEAPRERILYRRGARPGDGIYVSGVLGAAGVRRYAPVAFEPRLALGRYLAGRGATACMDLTDGLGIDLHRLCEESAAGAAIDRPLPVARGATLAQALGAGEDYELLFTAPDAARMPRSFRGLALTRIGTVVRRAEGVTLFGAPLDPLGYDHLQPRR